MQQFNSLPTMLTRLRDSDSSFDSKLARLLARDDAHAREVDAAVDNIITAVRRNGDAALIKFTNKFDRRQLAAAAELEVPREKLRAALAEIDARTGDALRAAAARIDSYHRFNVQTSWHFDETDGTRLGQRVTPLARVGVYVPGGAAAYPSSVLMNAIPGKIAGVGEIIMTAPSPDGVLNPAVLAAAEIAGVDRVFTLGGAQAVAALAYGTATVPAVDKIFGPGNRYVAAAKRRVFGQVGIDVIAGPSEVVVICDAGANPDWAAMDLLAQAEHDEHAMAIAITDDAAMADAIERAITKLLPGMQRREIITRALGARGAIIKVDGLTRAIEIANRIAPEHLELMTARAESLADEVKHAGAIFIGAHSAESLGDYCAGPNHVLPTAGAARFSSPLGVSDFQKRTSIIHASAAGAARMAAVAAVLARCEGLDAHARSAEYRLDNAHGGGQ